MFLNLACDGQCLKLCYPFAMTAKNTRTAKKN